MIPQILTTKCFKNISCRVSSETIHFSYWHIKIILLHKIYCICWINLLTKLGLVAFDTDLGKFECVGLPTRLVKAEILSSMISKGHVGHFCHSFASQDCHDKVAETAWVTTVSDIPEGWRLRSRCWQDWFLLVSLRRDAFPAFLSLFLVISGNSGVFFIPWSTFIFMCPSFLHGLCLWAPIFICADSWNLRLILTQYDLAVTWLCLRRSHFLWRS